MTDIVERLRAEGSNALARHYSLGMHHLCSDAADEIERLRAGGCARDQHTTQYCAELRAAVKAENEACARLVEEAASVTFDAGPPAPGKVLSGTVTITNIHTGVSQAAAAIRARMEAKP